MGVFAFGGGFGSSPRQRRAAGGLVAPDVYSGKRSHSGMILNANNVEGDKIQSIVKVKAHRDVDEEGISARERFLRLGNRDADAGAKHGLQLHPSDAALNLEVDALVTVARAYCILAANLLPLWPKLSLDVPYVPVPAASCQPKTSHAWKMWSGIWRCSQRLLGKRSPQEPPPGRCSNRSKLDDKVLQSLGHRVIAFNCSDGSVLFICVRCKCHSTGSRVEGLGERCEGKPSRRAGTGWNYLCRGQHPHEKRRPVTVSIDDVLELF